MSTPDTITTALIIGLPGIRILWVMIQGPGYRLW